MCFKAALHECRAAFADSTFSPGWAPGITKVKTETALSVLAYNILRAINLIGPLDLRARLG
jgi:hypothetical protein